MLQLSLKYDIFLGAWFGNQATSERIQKGIMTTTLENLEARTIHLPTEAVPSTTAPAKKPHKGLRLNDLRAGETGRIIRVVMPDSGCRKRFAELGLAEGMKVTVTTTGDSLMLQIGGSKMGIGARCAEQIFVARI